MTIRNQHYVWRHYLKAWAKDNDLVWCLREGKLFPSNTRNIMAKRDFYKLERISRNAEEYFDCWITTQNSPNMQKIHRRYFNLFKNTASVANEIQQSDAATKDRKAQMQTLLIELEERVHGEIERSVQPLMADMQQGNFGFIRDAYHAYRFFTYLGVQEFRTQKAREIVMDSLKSLPSDLDFRCLHHIFGLCLGINVGYSLFLDRKRLKIHMLTPSSGTFITGDQPIVNLDRHEKMDIDDIALYYPLGPYRAVLFSFENVKLKHLEMPCSVVDRLNEVMAYSSHQILVGNCRGPLAKYTEKPAAFPKVLPLLSRL